MAEVTIEWGVRANGRYPGTVETVEHTDYINSLILGGRVTVVGVPKIEPIVGVFLAEQVDTSTNDLGQVLDTAYVQDVQDEPVLSFEAEVEQAVATEAPKPKPRAPRG